MKKVAGMIYWCTIKEVMQIRKIKYGLLLS
jgi:hypothetical protein